VSKRFAEIARRKQALIDKARLERLELAAACARIRSPLDMQGTFFRIVRMLGAHPLATAGISSFVISGFGKKLFRSARLVFKLRQLVLPLWLWWVRRRRHS
jgi:hypothetical protein